MILGIESSCDESALALYEPGKGVIDDWVHSQIVKHSEYGGVVPDIAVLEHLNNFPPLLDLVGKKYNLAEIVSKISVTCGPGLVGCLGIGISVAKSLGILWKVPVVGVNHLRGHAFSPFMSLGEVSQWHDFLPHLGLLVSGGNTLLFSINKELEISILAKTVDDAVGEALDKGAKLLGIPYPGGAELERRSIGGNYKKYDFPQAFPQKSEMKFSFSGLKTSLLYTIQKMNENEVNHHFADLSASYQWAAVQQLVRKTSHAWNQGQFKSLGLSGGVANNNVLRSQMKDLADHSGALLLCAEPKYTGDNASMIAYASHVDPDNTWSNENQELSFNASLRLEHLSS
jgi:N6-L-threonylcarbamoyladenine synthase